MRDAPLSLTATIGATPRWFVYDREPTGTSRATERIDDCRPGKGANVLGLTAAGWVSLALGVLIAIAYGVLAMRE